MVSSARRPEGISVAVFAKAPVAGEVKTRLQALLGPDGAAALHAGLVRHALSTAIAANVGSVELWWAPDEHHAFFERCARDFQVRLERQSGPDLGARMAHAFEHALAQGDALIVIGSDCPALGAGHLRAARDALLERDAVLIPAEDGGYVLVGLSRRVPEIFAGVEWGTAAVMRQTRERIARAALRCVELEPLWDVDRPEDYARLRREGLAEEVLS